MKHIWIWCEYDISGPCGDGHEVVLSVDESATPYDIEGGVINYLKSQTHLCFEELEGMYSWSEITIGELTV